MLTASCGLLLTVDWQVIIEPEVTCQDGWWPTGEVVLLRSARSKNV